MTSVVWTPGLCPQCLSDAYAPLSDGRRLCLNPSCRHEYGPLDEPDSPVFDDVADEDGISEDVNAPLSTDDQLRPRLKAARELYVGSDVTVFELEQVGTVTEIGDDGLARIEFGSGFYVLCYPDEFALVESDVPADDVVQEIVGTDLTVVAQMLRAGIATIDVQDGAVRMGMAPDGWLPMEADIMPVIEHGASYLVAWLATTYQIPVSDLESAAVAFEDAARAAKEATNQ